MKTLVTGCAGFIGSHLVESLLERGEAVTGIDALTDYYEPAQKRKNLEALKRRAGFKFQEADLLNVDLAELLKDIAVVYHLAGEPGVRKSWGKEFSRYVDRNIRVTQLLLEAGKPRGLKRFVFASSSSVYGNRGGEVCQESDFCRPFSPYGVSKLAAESLCSLYHDNFGLPTVSLRYFTVFGPRQRPDMAFHRFLKNALAGKPIVVYGDGKQSRDFTYVEDAVSATMAAAEKGKPGRIYNVGGGCPATLEEVFDILRALLPKEKLNLQFEAETSGDVKHTRASIEAAKADLGYSPKTALRTGLEAELRWLSG